jgi:2-amino-4-hydroxy-6-hydroxymethyldihydropteridine diphosphokinase
MGDRLATLRRAADELPDVVGRSSVYETEPVGGPQQGPYLNAVLQLRTERSARQLLADAHAAEARADRVRLVRWGPRTLDVDVLWIEGETLDEDDLIVPHPRMWERGFVLVPLRELAPDLVDAATADAVGIGIRRWGSL